MNKIFRRFFRSPAFVLGISMLALLLVVTPILYKSNYQNEETNIKNYIQKWNSELAESIFQNKNSEMIKKISDGIRSYKVDSYSLISKDQIVLSSWNGSSVDCGSKMSKRILSQSGFYMGTFTACLSNSNIAQSTLFSPLIILCLFLVFIIIAISAYTPIRTYKKDLKLALDSLESLKTDPHGRAIKVSDSDNHITKMIRMIRQQFQRSFEAEKLSSQLEAENKLTRVMSQAAHDLKGPLNIARKKIKYSDAIPEGDRKDIDETLVRIKSICDDFSSHEKSNIYRFSNIKTANVSLLIEKIVEEKKITTPDISFINQVRSNLFAICVESDFQRVISNLLSNSVEALSLNEKGSIAISANEDSGGISLTITDNGVGISEKAVEHIFDENFTIGKENGTGLGLYYAKRKVQEWGGTIKVERKNNNTSFTIFLLKENKFVKKGRDHELKSTVDNMSFT